MLRSFYRVTDKGFYWCEYN